MSNLWVSSGTSYITAPTLGSIVGNKVRVVQHIEVTSAGMGYLFSQGALNNREFGLYIADLASGNPRELSFAWGGSFPTLGLVTTLFGAPTFAGVIDFEYNKATSFATLKFNGSTIASGTYSTGTARVDGTLFRIGARSADNTPGSTGGAYLASAGWKFGDQQIYVDDVLVRNYVMPASGTVITETVSGANGTLRVPSGSDWEVVTGEDTMPTPASFGSVEDVPVSTLTELTNAVVIAGVDAGIDIPSVPAIGTEQQISSDGITYGAWTESSANVMLGYYIRVRKLSSPSNNAPVSASVTVGGTVFSGVITTASLYPIKNIVIIGASLEYRPFNRSLVAPNAAGTAALVAAGLEGVNLYSNSWDGYTASQLISKIEEAVSAFPNDDTLFMCHPFGNDVSATRPYSSMTAGEITAFQNNVTNCMAAFGDARERAYFVGISFRSYANPRTSKTIYNDQSLGSRPYLDNFVKPLMLPHELNTDGEAVFDYYNLHRNENETILDNDGIHALNPAGLNRTRQFVAQVFKSLIVDGVKPPVIVPAANYLAPPANSTTTKTAYIGVARLGTFAVSSGSAVNAYTLTGTDAALFNIGSSTGIVDFKVAPAATGSGSVGVTTTNALGSSTQTINYTVAEVPASIGDNSLTAVGLTMTGIAMRGLTARGL